MTEEFILRCLEAEPESRWQSVAEMQSRFERVRRAQIDFQPVRAIASRSEVGEDWASRAVRLMGEGRYKEAEQIAEQLYQQSREPHAFLCMVSAACKDERYFEALHYIDSHPEMMAVGSPIRKDLRYLALKCYLETRQVSNAERTIDHCLAEEGESPSLLLQRASILGLQARYEEACSILMHLNRDFPQRPQVLKRLVLVYEQMRDPGKAAAFLKAYNRLAVEDPWARKKMARFSALGLM
jgi:serine/threonine-protein kinase